MAKVSKTKIDDLIKQASPRATTLSYTGASGKEISIRVNPVISHADFGSAAKEIATLQFAIDSETGSELYTPYLLPFAWGYAIFKYFTDINVDVANTDGLADEKAAERIWNLIMYTPVLGDVCAVIGNSVLEKLGYAAGDIVKERRELLRPGALKLWNDLDGIVSVLKAQVGDISTEELRKLGDIAEKLSQNNIIELMR